MLSLQANEAVQTSITKNYSILLAPTSIVGCIPLEVDRRRDLAIWAHCLSGDHCRPVAQKPCHQHVKSHCAMLTQHHKARLMTSEWAVAPHLLKMVVLIGSARCSESAASGPLPVTCAAIVKPTNASLQVQRQT